MNNAKCNKITMIMTGTKSSSDGGGGSVGGNICGKTTKNMNMTNIHMINPNLLSIETLGLIFMEKIFICTSQL